MSQQYPDHPRYLGGSSQGGDRPEPRPDGPNVPRSREDYPEGDACPECGAILDDKINREKHAIGHYGDEPLPVNHLTLVARQRQAAILGEDIPRR